MDIELRKRLLKLLYEHKEEHVGSCFTCLDIIDNIFAKKSEDDIFILSNGHAAYALYVILEKYYDHVDADALVEKHGGHPNWALCGRLCDISRNITSIISKSTSMQMAGHVMIRWTLIILKGA